MAFDLDPTLSRSAPAHSGAIATRSGAGGQPLDAAQRSEIEAKVNAATSDPEQRELLTQAYEQAAVTGDAQLQQDADQLAGLYRDRQILQLGRSIAPGSAAPEGWRKASDEELAAYGISREELHPQGSGFAAELFISDGDPNAAPVLAFEGTDFGDPQDVNADVAQALGNPEEYYNRAMSLATQLSQHSGGEVRFTGHSLGGGLATAAAQVTGGEGIVSNPAGVHDDTVSQYLAERGLAVPAGDDIRSYVVEGDLLTGLQNASQGLTADNAEVIAGAFNGIGNIYNGLTGAQLPTDASGADLLQLPDAAGTVTTFGAYNADGSARPAIVGMNDIIGRADRIMTRDANAGEVVGTGGGILGGAAAGSIFGPLGTIAGGIVGGIFGNKAGEAGGRAIGAVDAGVSLAADGEVRDSVLEMVDRHSAAVLYGAYDHRLSQLEASLRAQLPS
jgi:hypothetical protein